MQIPLIKRPPRDHCTRCGTCCRAGGPALHREDIAILLAGHVGHRHLVTIRAGEPVFDPFAEAVRPSPQEMIKVRGRGGEWTCCLYDEKTSSCTIYEHRFLECRLLKCWDPAELAEVAGRDLLVRADLINPGDPVLELIELHEQECSYQKVEELWARLSTKGEEAEALAALRELLRRDLAIRLLATREVGLAEEYELFIFGRPLFKVLEPRGLKVFAHGELKGGCTG
ncbi:YkgJ family cysteine cluster protein [Desulfovirgula thermocuniculi]|uniref:YkgJ family cysteine cluster protein n=1 Tax=Desulfovirgula thermocuniculi TaxID=348842 RepID=UPI00041067FA|nr:YkgJ family cysteine cluster protein [Desulfovirgula thermocuniculi]